MDGVTVVYSRSNDSGPVAADASAASPAGRRPDRAGSDLPDPVRKTLPGTAGGGPLEYLGR